MICNDESVGEATFTRDYLRTLEIERKYRGKGHGSNLLKEVEKQIKGKRYEECRVLAISTEHPYGFEEIKLFYEKNGYQRNGSLNALLGRGGGIHMMKKNLN